MFACNLHVMKNIYLRLSYLIVLLFGIPVFKVMAQTKPEDPKMNAFVSGLMGKMTLDEKIGQLNLVTAGRAITGSVVNNGIDAKIKSGQIGGVFGVYGATDVKAAAGPCSKDIAFAHPPDIRAGCDTRAPHYISYPAGDICNLGYGPDTAIGTNCC